MVYLGLDQPKILVRGHCMDLAWLSHLFILLSKTILEILELNIQKIHKKKKEKKGLGKS